MKKLQGLGSLLDFEHSQQIENLWNELEADCGLKGVRITPFPHFTWHVADDYRCDSLRLAELAASVEPFTIQTTGLALFTGESPIAYIPIVRTKALSEFHEIVWNSITPISINPNLYYR